MARADGSRPRRLLRLSRLDVLIVDDWAMARLSDVERRDFLEICDDRYQRRSTILTSQLPVAKWHAQIGDPTLADSILDRLVHNAHRIELQGESMRKKRARKAAASEEGELVTPRLTLKHHTDWFAAGREMQQALALLSDGAFKLYVYVCFHAERSSGRLRFRQNELAQSLGKSPRSISSYLKELQRPRCLSGPSRGQPAPGGAIEIADRFWPYHKQCSETPLSSPDSWNGFGYQSRYIQRVRQLFLSGACVQGTFSAADEKLATEWYQRHVPLEQVERAYLLGCARKYIALLNHPGATLISSLHYFTALLSEVVELKVSADYWSYLSHKVDRLEQRWRRNSAVPQVGQANFAPPNQRLATQDKGETR